MHETVLLHPVNTDSGTAALVKSRQQWIRTATLSLTTQVRLIKVTEPF